MNNKNHHPECLEILEKVINVIGDAGYPNVITFTGLADTSDEKNGSMVSCFSIPYFWSKNYQAETD